MPLFNAIYERYKGYSFPVTSGLETEINALGVSSKQADARQLHGAQHGRLGSSPTAMIGLSNHLFKGQGLDRLGI